MGDHRCRVFDIHEHDFEEIHTALCPGGDKHVPRACEPFHSVWKIIEKTELKEGD